MQNIILRKKKNQEKFIFKNYFHKIMIFIIILSLISKYKDEFIKIKKNFDFSDLNINYKKIQKNINLKFKNKLKNKIRIAIYTYSLKNGGLQRFTSLFLKYFNKIKIYELYLYTQISKEKNEYIIPKNISRTVIIIPRIENLIKQAYKNNIDILIYNFYNFTEINILNKLTNIKIIFYIHQCFLYWIYFNYFAFKSLYKAYQNSKYVISIIPFENDYLFRKWGINSILMYNFISYEINSVIPSDLSSSNILMIGRANNKLKRFQLGIKAMKYIIQEIPKCEMIVISQFFYEAKKLVNRLNLKNNIKFIGYSSKPELYFKNASLHIFPSISEAFPMVLCETKIYGIPNILLGIDYVSNIKGGTIIIYDDKPESIANEALKILKNYKYRKKLGKEARESMKIFKNELILKKWNKIILSIYNGKNYFQQLRDKDKNIPKNRVLNILKNQLELLKIRKKKFQNTTINDLNNFTYLENL